jgi:hypothetical protein
MSDLTTRKCVPCEGGVTPLSSGAAEQMLTQLASGWALSEDGKFLRRSFKFVDFYRTTTAESNTRRTPSVAYTRTTSSARRRSTA